MCVVDVDCPFDNGLTSVNTVIPTPLFGRYSAAEGRRLAVYVVACDEDLRSIGSLPTFNDAINWRIVRADQSVETDTLIKLVIWDASFAANLPISLDDRQQTGPSLIAYRTPDTPPHLLKGRPTSRLCFQGSINSLLRRLAYSLIIPEAYEGLICVAYEDVAKAVSRGGEMLQFVQRGEDVQYVIASMLRVAMTHLESLRPNASICLGVLAGSESLTHKLVDEIMHQIFKVLHPEIFVVISATAHPGSEVCISVLTTSGDSCESSTDF